MVIIVAAGCVARGGVQLARSQHSSEGGGGRQDGTRRNIIGQIRRQTIQEGIAGPPGRIGQADLIRTAAQRPQHIQDLGDGGEGIAGDLEGGLVVCDMGRILEVSEYELEHGAAPHRPVQQRREQLAVLQIARMILRGGGGCEVGEGAGDGDCGLGYV